MAARERGPTDRQLALAGILVAGVVGVFGPLITWQATRDSQQTATHAELVRTDRAEIRKILDEAALALNSVNGLIGAPGITDWTGEGRPLNGRTFQRDLAAVDRNRQRLVIRLGTEADASKEYVAALNDQVQAIATYVTKPPTDREIAAVEKLADKADEHYGRFIEAANRIAGSTLD